jgi:hypothetical protein
MRLRQIDLWVCVECLAREGFECHTPGCAFWMHDVPTVDTAAALRAALDLSAAARSVPEDDERGRPTCREHRVEWAVLSDDGQVYEVENKGHDRAHFEADLLRDKGEPTASVIERRICEWALVWRHEPDRAIADAFAKKGTL